jgi:hypothetical protein
MNPRSPPLTAASLPGRRALGRARRESAFALRRATSFRRTLPDFVIIGAQRAGTTSLHAYLSEHTLISPSRPKEVHYFDNGYGHGLGWYRAHFAGSRQPGGIAGEATPYYLFHPLTPQRMARDLPSCKLIVLLRNPVDRAVSQYHHARAWGYEELSLEQGIRQETARLQGEEERLRRDDNYRSFAHQHLSYVARGRYALQLERWFEHFDRDQFLILKAEDLFTEPEAVVAESQRFLGLTPQPPADLHGRNIRSYDSVSDALQSELQATFEPENQRLRNLLGRDFAWH